MLDFSKPDTPLTPAQQQQRRNRNIRFLLLAQLGILLYLRGASWTNLVLAKAAVLGLPWPVLVLTWIVSIRLFFFILTFLHEGGHIVGAYLSDFQIISFAAGRLRIERKPTGWKIRWRKSQDKVGGMVQAYTTNYQHLRSRYALFVAGGPAANLISGIAALLLHYGLGPAAKATIPGYLLSSMAMLFGWLSVAVGVLNLLPIKLKSGYTNDGRQLLQLWQNGPAMHQKMLIVQLLGTSYAGYRSRTWERALVEKLLTYRSESVLDFYAQYYAYCYFLDRDDLEQLRHHLNEALDLRHLAPATLQQHILSEAAYVAALRTHNTEQARYWLNSAQAAKPFTDEDALFARAAVAWAEGQFLQARQWLIDARSQLADSIDVGGRIQATEYLDALEARIQQASPALATA